MVCKQKQWCAKGQQTVCKQQLNSPQRGSKWFANRSKMVANGLQMVESIKGQQTVCKVPKRIILAPNKGDIHLNFFFGESLPASYPLPNAFPRPPNTAFNDFLVIDSESLPSHQDIPSFCAISYTPLAFASLSLVYHLQQSQGIIFQFLTVKRKINPPYLHTQPKTQSVNFQHETRIINCYSLLTCP